MSMKPEKALRRFVVTCCDAAGDYELVTADLPGQFRRTTDFHGVAPSLPRTDFKKQRTRSLWDSVENYGKLKAHFQGTDWEMLFDD